MTSDNLDGLTIKYLQQRLWWQKYEHCMNLQAMKVSESFNYCNVILVEGIIMFRLSIWLFSNEWLSPMGMTSRANVLIPQSIVSLSRVTDVATLPQRRPSSIWGVALQHRISPNEDTKLECWNVGLWMHFDRALHSFIQNHSSERNRITTAGCRELTELRKYEQIWRFPGISQ